MSEPEPLVSIIVPVYNAEQYLPYCVESIINQSYRNLEIILIDDGSTDDSPRLCDDYAAKDDRIKVIHQPNGGIGRAQNAGLHAATGDYLAFADNDDILDRHNIEFLLHAIQQTGADMSKARWQQFGVSQLTSIRSQASRGASQPKHITVFKDPLTAYQSVFSKTQRIIGTWLGRNTEAKYFNEANWCRLYKRSLWKGIAFPPMYAQDVYVAGSLYQRMHKVADLDAVLYYWLQSPKSVTHSNKTFLFYHDNYTAGDLNFYLGSKHGVLPKRSYYTMMGGYKEEKSATDFNEPGTRFWRDMDSDFIQRSLDKLTFRERLTCEFYRMLRLFEKHVYDLKVKNMK